MIQFLLAAPRSGSGKTTMTCALLMALKRRGHAPCAFKNGPDYIDPMFHRAVLGVEASGASATGPVRGIWPTRWVCRYCWWQSRKVRA